MIGRLRWGIGGLGIGLSQGGGRGEIGELDRWVVERVVDVIEFVAKAFEVGRR